MRYKEVSVRVTVGLLLLVFIAGGCLLAFGLGWQQSERQVAEHRKATLPGISGIVIPHHDLVKTQRQALLNAASKQIASPSTVVLVSTNHFSTGLANVQTTDQTWNISSGVIDPDKQVIRQLIDSNAAELEPGSFASEHGIKLVLGDLRAAFPEAKLVPLILKPETNRQDIALLENVLLDSCGTCLLVASVDFSHYQPALLADLHDRLTYRALVDLNDDLLLSKAEVDSPPALALLTQWASSHQTRRFVLRDHTNSGVMAGNPDLETTTHILGWYENGELGETDSSVTFTLGGNLSMSGKEEKELEYHLAKLGDRVFWGTDISLVTKVGRDVTITPEDTCSSAERFDKELKFFHMSLLGTKPCEARLETTAYQDTTDGQPQAQERVVSVTGKGLTVHVLPIDTLDDSTRWSRDVEQLLQVENNRLVVYLTWHDEYQFDHTEAQSNIAHFWIEQGADMVVGNHPEGVQDSELYLGHPIFYSLGNVIDTSANTLSDAIAIILTGEFTQQGLELAAFPVTSAPQPSMQRGEEKDRSLGKILFSLEEAALDQPGGRVYYFVQN